MQIKTGVSVTTQNGCQCKILRVFLWIQRITLFTFGAASGAGICGTLSPRMCLTWLMTTSTADPVVKPLIIGSDIKVAKKPSWAAPIATWRGQNAVNNISPMALQKALHGQIILCSRKWKSFSNEVRLPELCQQGMTEKPQFPVWWRLLVSRGC